jgi:hypothetical protein
MAKVPAPVIVPPVIPVFVLVATEVTVPFPLLLKVFQSVLDKKPLVEAPA